MDMGLRCKYMFRVTIKQMAVIACLYGVLIHPLTLYAQTQNCRPRMNDFNCLDGTCIGAFTLIFQSENSGDNRKNCRNVVELYPEGITRIQGDLSIGIGSGGQSFSADITDLSKFRLLEEVTGNLIVDTVRTLRNLEQLNRLRTIGGDFVIGEGAEPNASDGTGLEQVGDLPALTTIGRRFVVSENDRMTTLGSFPELRSIGRRFSVNNNGALAALGHFPKLQSIGEGMLVVSNRQLESLGRFPTLTFLGGFRIFDNDGMLSRIESFIVTENNRLTSLGAFPALRTIDGDFLVGRRGMQQGNRRLESVDSFPVLGSVQGDFSVFDNDELTSLGDFSMLRNIEGRFRVESNRLLTSLNDFSGLERISGNIVEVVENRVLTNCCRLPKSVLATVQAAVLAGRRGRITFMRNASHTCSGSHTSLIPITNALCSRLSASPEQVLFPPASNTGSITIEASRGFRASTEADWVSRLRVRYASDRPPPPAVTRPGGGGGALSLSRRGGGRGLLFITVDPNGATTERSSTLTLTAAGVDDLTIPIYQRGTADQRPTFGGTTVAARFYTQGEVVVLTLPEASDGNAPLVYTLTPELPAGLSFDSAGRRISGVPTEEMGTTRYTYTVTDADNDQDMLTVDLTVNDRSEPTFSGQTVPDQFYSERSEFINTLFLPSAVGGSGELTYILTPPLPEGLDFSGDQQIVTGTNAAIGVTDRIAATERTEYTYSVMDAGSGRDSLSFDVVVLALSPELNADSRVDQRDAQALYYAYLPGLNETTQEALFGRLGVADDDDTVAELRARAGFWRDLERHNGPSPDLNQDRRIDQQDARILYYTYRFGELLESSEGLRNALLGGLSSNPSEVRAVLDRANALISSQR